MAIHSRVKIDTTSVVTLLSPDTGYKYEIYGWVLHNNGTKYTDYNSGVDFSVVGDGIVSNLYGVYQTDGAGALSYAGVWQLPIHESPYFEIPEGKYLYLSPDSTRLSGVLWYEKVSTTTTSIKELIGGFGVIPFAR